ncbi:MAG: hypothetical protein U0X39_02060 [Bacteroidales bacterium]
MKKLRKILLAAVIIMCPSLLMAQNWMMAQSYTMMVIDSIMGDIYDSTATLKDFEIESFYYDEDDESYSIDFNFTVVEDGKETVDSYNLAVALTGGMAMVDDDILFFEIYDLPDMSENVFIHNTTDSKISFSLSCDDNSFSTFSLGPNEYNNYSCDEGKTYIIIVTRVDGKETGRVHYQLDNKQGYKVKYDTENQKFEVYTDNQIVPRPKEGDN